MRRQNLHGRSRADSLQHSVDMALHTNFAPDVQNFAIFADKERRPFNAHIFSAACFFHPNAVGLEHFLIRIAQ